MSCGIGGELVESHADVLRCRRCYGNVRPSQLHARPVAKLAACELLEIGTAPIRFRDEIVRARQPLNSGAERIRILLRPDIRRNSMPCGRQHHGEQVLRAVRQLAQQPFDVVLAQLAPC